MTPRSRAVLLGSGRLNPARLFAGGYLGDWWDGGDTGTLFQENAATTPIAADQTVGAWRGKVNGNLLIQATAGARPLWRTTKFVEFDGTDDFLGLSFALTAYPLTLAVAVKWTSSSGNGIISLANSDSAYKMIIVAANAPNLVGGTDRNVSNTSLDTNVSIPNSGGVAIGEFDAAQFNVTVNGVGASKANTNAFGTSVSLFLGKTRPAGLFATVSISQAFAINRLLTAQEKAGLTKTLLRRAGLS